ncbi:threonine--tRNA ligase [Rickettsiales bacterium]|nr:threonine--tRNA ligase [Rickettsiales bacterium]
MIKIILPDDSARIYDDVITGFELASSLALSSDAVAVKIDGELIDLSARINKSCRAQIITFRDREGLEIIRHDAAHIMAEAIKELYPGTKLAIGPVIEDGFYYDFDCPHCISTDDLPEIEAKMHKIVARAERFVRREINRSKAINLFKKLKEDYKLEIISSISPHEEVSVYNQGDFVDLCKGPHSPNTSRLKAFKLLKVAGSYWRGDSRNKMLQRIYGTAWADQKDLEAYLERLAEAEKRDHRKIGQELGLFHLQGEALGQVFWHPKGWTIYRALQDYLTAKLEQDGYFEVSTPLLLDRSLWEKSGHWAKFKENMFISEADEKVLAIKPMSCPCHVEIFKSAIRSYRDLPMRMAEFGHCHRNEPSGGLHGLMRVRGFVQDDAHIFCTEEQIEEETIRFCKLLYAVYRDLGFSEISVKFADRPEKRAGNDGVWDRAEAALAEAVAATGIEYSMNKGEGAFYGPKLEFVLKDAIGRDWQCGTLQVDFVLPQSLQAHYIGPDGKKHHPVILHRAILGTFERFIGILIEQYSGKLPMWLAPVQTVVINISGSSDEYAQTVFGLLKQWKIRVELDITSEKTSYKIKKYSLLKVPLICIVGNKEANSSTVTLRRLGSKAVELVDLDKLRFIIAQATALPGLEEVNN